MSFRFALRALLITLCLASLAAAGPITKVVAFGDSLTDNGNLFVLDGGTYPPVPPYFGGRGSNGPVAVEYLAAALGVPLEDYAVYGANSGVGNKVDGGTPTALGALGLPGMLGELNWATAGGTKLMDPDALYFIWGGANDAQYITSAGDVIPMIGQSLNNILTIAASLHALGAERIVVAGLPDMGLIPVAAAGGPAVTAALHFYSTGLNSMLLSYIPLFPYIQFFDTDAVFKRVLANPGAYGFTDVTGQCVPNFAPGTTPIPCSNPEDFFFWDDFHPTTKGHQILAAELAASVPEPASAALVLAGLFLGFAVRRKLTRLS